MAPTTDETARHLQRLAALVAQRRAQLRLKMEDAARACDVAYMTYWKIENGQSVRASTYSKVEVAYDMRAGSCRAVLDGVGVIVLNDGSELIEGATVRDFKKPGLADELDSAFDKSAQLAAPHLTLSEARAMKEEMLRELRERGVLKSE